MAIRKDFRTFVEAAYTIIQRRQDITMEELQEELNLPPTPFENVRKALLAMHPDVEDDGDRLRLKR